MMSIRHLLLDIEGTTCPVSFVSKTLFPYAKHSLGRFIAIHQNDKEVRVILEAAVQEWLQDRAEISRNLRDKYPGDAIKAPGAITEYLLHLINIDKKSTALKDIQGKIWRKGYQCGELKGALFPETATSFQQWTQQKILISSYSSGSIQAQQLLYQHSIDGDLSANIHQWFDTHTGPKKSSSSYATISQRLNSPSENILFVSDNPDECNAARGAGLATLFSLREGNPDQDPQGHRVIRSLVEVNQYL